MATGECVSPKDMLVHWSEYSDCGTSTDLSGSFNVVEQPEQSRISGEAYNFEDDVACVGCGKREPVEVSFSIVYTDDAADAFQVLQPYFTNGSEVCIAWYPGGTTGSSGYGVYGQITNWVYPGGEASSADPMICGLSVRANEIDLL